MNHLFRFSLILLISSSLLLIEVSIARNYKNGTRKPAVSYKTTDGSVQSLINIGNFAYWFQHTGISGHNPITGGGGGYYPRGTSQVIYRDGLIWAGYVRDPDPDKPQLRAGGNDYRNGTQPGVWNLDPNDERARIYRICRDWQTLTYEKLIDEAAEFYSTVPENITPQMLDDLIKQYKEDWKNWPVDLGAPFYDVNDNGVYDPVLDEDGMPVIARFDANGHIIEGGDYPGLAEADMTLWFAINDNNAGKAYSFAASPPIGLEIQITAWGYNQPEAAMGQIILKKYKITNHSGFVIDSLYFGQWSDPDIGFYGDDLIGCDSVAQLMFGYNGYHTDIYFRQFGITPPAVCYNLLQGPIVPSTGDTAIFNLEKLPDFKNLPMTSFAPYNRPDPGELPQFPEYGQTLKWFNALRGYRPTPSIDEPTPFTAETGPRAGKPTKFPLSGDPAKENSQTADLDGYLYDPGERRMMMCSGPVSMEPGAVQEIMVAIIGGLGGDNLQSVSDARGTAFATRSVYNNLFKSVPKPPAVPHVKVTALERKIVLDWGWDAQAVAETEKITKTGYAFEGYNVYQLPSYSSKLDDPGVIRVATFDRINGITMIKSVRYYPKYGGILELPVQYGTDSGVQRYFIVEKDYIHNLPLYRGSKYYFAVSAYNYGEVFVRD